MMDGLEFSEIYFSKIDLGDRIDSDYYTKNYIYISEQLKKVTTKKLDQLATTVASAFYPAATHLYSKGDTAFARCVDCVSFPIITKNQDSRFEKIPYSFAMENKGIAIIKSNDIIITKVGTPCYASLLTDYEEIALSRTVLGLTAIRNINPSYLMIFLRSKYGFEQLYRQRELTIQYQLTLSRVKFIDIYMAGYDLQKLIKKICSIFKKLMQQSIELYKQAEDSFLSYIGLVTPLENDLYTVKDFSKSVLKSGRFDAEYYQPKYDLIVSSLNTKETLESICNLYDENYLPDEEKYYRYIELANVGGYGEITDTGSIVGEELPTRARRIVKSGQVIVSSIEGSLQSCALITDEFDGAICSTGFYVVDSDKLSSETLLVLFKSEAIQELLKQRCSGTILTSINKDEFLSLPLPKIDEDIQAKISEQIKESFALRRKSKQLLEDAKRAVEIAIEQDEESAIEWLKERKKEVGA